MSHPEAADAASSIAGNLGPNLQNSPGLLSSRNFHSPSRLSHYTEATTRRSSFQSAQASLYTSADGSLAYDDANESFTHLDLGSDLELRQRPRSRAASPFDYARPGSAASMNRASTIVGGSREDPLETTQDASTSSGHVTGALLGRRRSGKRQSVDELNRPQSSMSRRSSASGSASGDPQYRLRDAATAAASRASLSRRHSTDIDGLSRASTPHGFRTDDDDADPAARPPSRTGSSHALRRYEQDDGTFIKRGEKDRSSILPPAAFFAPKKPSARNSTSNLLASNTSQAGRSTTPLSFYSAGQPAAAPDGVDADNEEVLNQGSTDSNAYARAPSPWGMAASIHSVGSSSQHTAAYGYNAPAANGNAIRTPLDANDGFPTPSALNTPQSVVRMMASTDPLLPARAIPNALSHPNGSTSHHGLGLDTNAATTREAQSRNGHGAMDQRASLPTKRRSTPQAENPPQPAAAAPTSTSAAKKPQRGRRNYRNHKGENRFLLSGLLMTSSDNPLPFILSYLVLLILGGLFYGFEAPWLSRNISPAVPAFFTYIWLQAVVNMGVTAFRDPGVIPRGLDPDPPCVLGDSAYEPGRQALADPEDPLAIPVQRVLRIRNQTVKVKWCGTCGTYRPPRSSHCRVCDNCVENIDHHCTYLNTCIGRRNYVQFMVFLFTSILSALYVIAFTALRLVLLTKPRTYRYPRNKGSVTAPGYTFRQALSSSPVSAVLFILCIAAVAPLLVLFAYHVRLVLLNRSTVEQIRINTAREYGEHKGLELGVHGEDDTASTYGAEETNRRGRGRGRGAVRAIFERFGVLKPKYRDPNPFASRSTRVNVRNALGWRSVMLESWIDRRGREVVDERVPHPRMGGAAGQNRIAEGNGLQWKP